MVATGLVALSPTNPASAAAPTITKVAAGEFGCAVLSDGSVNCWGTGPLGERRIPTWPSGLPAASGLVTDITGATDVGVGAQFMCAIVSGGAVKCHGWDYTNQLGDPSADSPGDVRTETVRGLTGATSLSVGLDHSCVVVSDGSVRCWGNNAYAKLGSGDTTPNVLSTVPGLTAKAVAAGSDHTCAIRTDGSVACWGANGSGQLGAGTVQSSTPVTVPGVSGATAIASGDFYTCAVVAGGSVTCWGANAAGQLGRGTTSASGGPGAVSSLSGATGIAAGSTNTCAWLADGTARCWGANGSGQIGDGSRTTRPAPVPVSGLGSVSQMAVGRENAFAVAGGTVMAWGDNSVDVDYPVRATLPRLGDGTNLDRLTPVPVIGLGAAGSFVPVQPTRRYDSRQQQALLPGEKRTISAVNYDWASSAVTLTVTVTEPGAAGYLTVSPTGEARPTASNLNFVAGQTVANQVTVKTGTSGQVDIFNGANAPVHVVVDLAGYTKLGTAADAGMFNPVSPARVLDTREGNGASGPVGAGGVVDLQVTGRGGLPASASAVVLNVAVTDTAAGGFVTAYPSDAARPTASNLNFVPGQTAANQVVVKVGPDGKVKLFNGAAGTVSLVADVAGYYVAGSASLPGAFVPMVPSRAMDTRASGKFASFTGVVVPGASWLPAGGKPGAVVANLTATEGEKAGHFSAYPPEQVNGRDTSSVNFVAGETIAALTTRRVSSTGGLAIYNASLGRTHAVMDVAGYYIGY